MDSEQLSKADLELLATKIGKLRRLLSNFTGKQKVEIQKLEKLNFGKFWLSKFSIRKADIALLNLRTYCLIYTSKLTTDVLQHFLNELVNCLNELVNCEFISRALCILL